MPAIERLVRRQQHPASSLTASGSTASSSAMMRSGESSSVSVMIARPSLRHPRRGRLHREHDPASRVLLGPLQLALHEVAGGDLGHLLGGDLQAGGEVVLARAERRSRPGRCRSTGRRSCRPSRPCRASRGSPGRDATTPSRRGSSRAARRRSGAGRSGRCPALRRRRGTARSPCAGSALVAAGVFRSGLRTLGDAGSMLAGAGGLGHERDQPLVGDVPGRRDDDVAGVVHARRGSSRACACRPRR